MVGRGVRRQRPRAAGQLPAGGVLLLQSPLELDNIRAAGLQLGLQPRQDQPLLVERVPLQPRQQFGSALGHAPPA
ncbi:MAG: hypothetical protein ACJ8H8_25775 [Geminicoccaceae bacterium]